MLSIFSRKELIPIFSAQRLYAVQAELDAAGIPHHTKYVNSAGRIGGRGRGLPFQNPDAAYEYKIFVHRDDYDRALAAIQPALRRK